MKYNEIIEKIEKFKLDFRYGKVEDIEDDDPFEIDIKQIPFMEKYLDQLYNAEDLNITHDEYLDIDKEMISGNNLDELEELLTQTQTPAM